MESKVKGIEGLGRLHEHPDYTKASMSFYTSDYNDKHFHLVGKYGRLYHTHAVEAIEKERAEPMKRPTLDEGCIHTTNDTYCEGCTLADRKRLADLEVEVVQLTGFVAAEEAMREAAEAEVERLREEKRELRHVALAAYESAGVWGKPVIGAACLRASGPPWKWR